MDGSQGLARPCKSKSPFNPSTSQLLTPADNLEPGAVLVHRPGDVLPAEVAGRVGRHQLAEVLDALAQRLQQDQRHRRGAPLQVGHAAVVRLPVRTGDRQSEFRKMCKWLN